MEIKNQKLKSSNTSSNLKKYSKYQSEIRANIHKNHNNNNTNSIFNINKNNNNNNCKLLKLPHTNNIFSNEKDKINKNKKQNNETKNNKLILEIDEEKEKDKGRQNSYSGLMKTEECVQNGVTKNLSINKRSFLGKTSNFSPFKSKTKKDFSINNENINNNNIPKNNNNKNEQNHNKSKNMQFKTLIKVKENKKKFTRTFSGYGVKRKSSMNNKNVYINNFNVNNKQKTNYSQNKQKEQVNLNNNNLNKNSNHFINENEKSKNSLSKSAKKCKIKNYLNNTIVKSSKINEDVNPINNYREKSPLGNCSFKKNNEINNINNEVMMNKTGNNFYENKIKKKFFNGNISYNANINNVVSTNKNVNKTENIISINLKDIETNNNKNNKNNNNSVTNNIINIKVKMTNRIIPVNSIRDKPIFVEQTNPEPVNTTTKNISKKNITLSTNNNNSNGKTKPNSNNNNNNNNNNETTIKQKNNKSHKHNSAKYSKNKIKKIKNNTESKSQNKSTKINLEKQFDNNANINVNNNNNNTLKKSNPNLQYKTSEKTINKKAKEKSKGKEKELLAKTKKYPTNYNNDFSTISHRVNIVKGSSLSTIKTNKTINTNVVKYPNIDCIKKRFIEGPLTINEIEENNENNNQAGYSFIINIISNWGNKKQVGLTEIELYDFSNKKIKINNIKIKGGEGNANENLTKLFNNKIHTINENEMWLIDINKNNMNSQDINISLYVYANIDNNKSLLDCINYIIIWNYNGWEVNKGIKKIEIFKDENIFYSGVIPRGDHTLLTDHSYKINLRKKYVTKKSDNQKGSTLNINNNNKNNSIKIEKYKHQRESSFDGNYISCNISVSNKNFKYNKMKRKKIENESMKNQRNGGNFSFLKVSSKKKSDMDLNSLFSTFKNHFSSRSCKKEKKNNSYMMSIGSTDKLNILQNLRKTNFNNSNIIVNSSSTNNLNNLYNLNKDFNNNIGIKNDNMNLNNDNGAVKNIVIKNKIFSAKNQSYDNKKKYTNNQESSNKLLTNIKSITFNNNIPKNIYNSLRNEDPNRKNSNSIFLSSTLRVGSFNSLNQKNIPYISFKKIRINILSNYGNQLSVGLTGICLIDNNLQKINIESAYAVGALPKDLRTVYKNENDYRVFENLFNGENNTIDENNMWLTLISHEPYIEICFKDYINLSRIEIWNFNEPMSLDNGVKEIEIIFDDDEENNRYNLFLWKGLGIDYFNYFQTIKCEENYLKKLSNRYLKLKNDIDTINLPIGFIFRIVFISNYGDEETISLKKIEIYNEKDEKLNKYNVIDDTNYTINLRDGIINDLLVDDYFYYHEFYDFHKNKDSFCNNIIYICFDEIVQIKYIKIDNTNDERFKMTSSKEIQIYCDDILLYEGKLKQMGENVISFEKDKISEENAINGVSDKETAEKNYNSYKEIKNDGVCRLVFEN